MSPPILLAVETAVSRAPQLSNQKLLNFLTERQPPDSKGAAPLFGAPGVGAFSSAGTGPSRGGWNFNGLAYFVSGEELYSVDATGLETLLGSGITGNNPVGMSDNGVQLIVVNGVQGWIYTLATNAFTLITSAAFYPAFTVIFMDGYFILDRAGTNEFFLSALYDGLTYNGLDFASAEGQPGFVVATVQNLQLLFVMASGHIELWYDAGTNDFPFQRYAGGIINYGCESPYSITKQDGAIFFLGADKVYYRLQANVPVRVSTHPIETLISRDNDLANAEVFSFTIQGHKLVYLTLTGLQETVGFDISTGKWHDRDSVDEGFISLGRWRARCAVEIYNKILVGDAIDGRLGAVDWTVYTEYGNPMRGLIHTVNQHHDRFRIFISRFELDVQAGVGLTTGQGSDPQIMLRRSKDGGMTWSVAEPWRGMGKEGEYTQRLRWLRQGQGRQIMWQLLVTDPVPRTIIAAHADIDVGSG
jgi:hypothetical protein